MNRPLAVLFVIMEAADFATFSLAPHLEANPLVAALSVPAVAVLKAAIVVVALYIVSRISTPSRRALALGCGIAVASIGVGANIATLSMLGY